MVSRPSIVRIVIVDLAANLAFHSPLLFWIFYGVILLSDRERVAGQLCIDLLLVTTVVGALMLLLRVRVILKVFAEGVEATATVSRVGFRRGIGYFAYTYP